MNRVVEVTSSSETETYELGRAVGACLQPGDTILLFGDLGSGKTVVAKGIISQALGVSPDDVVSPTFTLINSFEGRFAVHHADLYRLEPDQIDDIGLEETTDQDAALVVEWAEKMGSFGADPLKIWLDRGIDAHCRLVRFEWNEQGNWQERLDAIVHRELR